MIDASKAFNRIRHDRLFEVLLERKVQAIVIRLLIAGYISQMVKVRWNRCVSEGFNVENGIKQGGIFFLGAVHPIHGCIVTET